MIQSDGLPFYKITSYEHSYLFAVDEEKQYKKLRKKLGPTWKYYDYESNPIVTKENELGYRSKTVYPTEEYFLHLGCSNTYGLYLHEEDRASNLIENATGIPVINLGICGGGANIIGMNVQKLAYSTYQMPKAIFVQWPHLDRVSFPVDYGVMRIRANMTPLFLFKNFIREPNLIKNLNDHAFHSVNSLNIPVINYAIDQGVSDYYDVCWIERLDQARDNIHCGTETNKVIAEYILEQINVQV
jgi:hypothetical protein